MAFDLFALGLKIETDGVTAAVKPLHAVDAAGKSITKTFLGTISPMNALKNAVAGVSAAFVAMKVVGVFKDAIAEAADAEQQLIRLKTAVENAGGNFARVAPEADAVANSIQRLSRYSDDAVKGALADMITVTGDIRGSMQRLTLVTNLAAQQQIPLATAADVVARAMAGNVTQLQRMFPSLKDNADALGTLSKMLGGSAAADAATFAGRLEQVRNAWANVLEAVGAAILGTDAASKSTNATRDALVKMETWVVANSNSISDLVTGLGQLVTVLSKVAGWMVKIAAMDLKNLGPLGKFFSMTTAMALAPTKALFGAITGGSAANFGDVTGGGSNTVSAANLGTVTIGGGRGGGVPNARRGPRSIGLQGIGAGGIQSGGLPTPGGFAGEIKIPEMPLDEVHRQLAEFEQGVSDAVDTYIVGGVGEALRAGFAAAFSGEGITGVLKGFTSSLVGSLGSMFIELGKHLISFGTIMETLKKALTNIFGAGTGAIVAGGLLIALGAAMSAGAGKIMGGGGSRGGGGSYAASAGSARGIADSSTTYRYNPQTMDMTKVNPLAPVSFTVIGTKDIQAQNDIADMVIAAQRRGRG